MKCLRGSNINSEGKNFGLKNTDKEKTCISNRLLTDQRRNEWIRLIKSPKKFKFRNHTASSKKSRQEIIKSLQHNAHILTTTNEVKWKSCTRCAIHHAAYNFFKPSLPPTITSLMRTVLCASQHALSLRFQLYIIVFPSQLHYVTSISKARLASFEIIRKVKPHK